jgi:hypothetical protein
MLVSLSSSLRSTLRSLPPLHTLSEWREYLGSVVLALVPVESCEAVQSIGKFHFISFILQSPVDVDGFLHLTEAQQKAPKM